MMAAVGLLLIVCILIFLVWPVMRPVKNGYMYFTSGRASGQELKDERAIILANLQDLRIEAEAGKIPDEELKKLSGPLVRDLDRIERTLKQTREIQRPDDASICPDCFRRRKEHDSLCLQCGHRFED